MKHSRSMYGVIMTARVSRAFLARTLTHRSVFFEVKNSTLQFPSRYESPCP